MTARLIRRAAAAAAFGFAVTVAIAWASAAWSPAKIREIIVGQSYDYQATWYWHTIYRHRGLGFDAVMLEPSVAPMTGPWNDERFRAAWLRSARDLLTFAKDQWPEPFEIDHVVKRAETHPFWAGVMQDARGWPAPALWCEWHWDATNVKLYGPLPTPTDVEGGVPLAPRTAIGWVTVPRALPFRPMWRGLLLDVAVFGGAYFLLRTAAANGRRLIRLRRGRCPSCAYDLRGQVVPGCSECGWKRATSGTT